MSKLLKNNSFLRDLLAVLVFCILLGGVVVWWSSYEAKPPRELGLSTFTVMQGGTGTTTLTQGAVLYGYGTSSFRSVGPCGDGKVLGWLSNVPICDTDDSGGGSASIDFNPLSAAYFVGTSTATTTITGGLYATLISAPYFHATSSTATSTFNSGIKATTIGTGLVISSSGNLGQYQGTACTNQFARSLNASGVATCASVASTDVDSTIAVSARNITVAGTASQIVSSAGAQDLTADRTWTLSLANALSFPNTFYSLTGTTTLFSSASTTIGNLTVGLLTATSTATSTFTGGIQTKAINATTASSTINGLVINGGGVKLDTILNCSGGIITSAAGVLSCNTTAFASSGTTITVAGTANQITSSAGAQDLSTNRTWTLSLPTQVIFPNTFTSPTGTSTLFASASSTIGNLTVGTFVATSTEEKIFSITVASTSPAFIGGTNIPIVSYARYALELTQYRCWADGGTSVVLGMTDGTNATETVTCATTLTSDTDVGTNDQFTIGELKYLDFGTVTGAVNYVTFEAYGYVRR